MSKSNKKETRKSVRIRAQQRTQLKPRGQYELRRRQELRGQKERRRQEEFPAQKVSPGPQQLRGQQDPSGHQDLPGQHSLREQQDAPREHDLRSRRMPLNVIHKNSKEITLKGKVLKVTDVEMSIDDMWSEAREHELRCHRIGNRNQVKLPSDAILEALAERAYCKMSCLYTYKTGNKIKREYTSKKREQELEELIKECVMRKYMKFEKNRKKIEINGVDSVFVNESQYETNLADTLVFEHIDKNEVKESKLKRMASKMEKLEEGNNLHCECEGECGPSCPCGQMEKMFRSSTFGDYSNRRTYTCSDKCRCKGSCCESIQKAPEKGTEVVLHQETEKGAVVVAKQYFDGGETVASMSGIYVPTKGLSRTDDYAMDIISEEDGNVVRKILTAEGNKAMGSVVAKKFVNSLSKELKSAAVKSFSQEISLNPRDASNIGRFISSSCSGNVETTTVYSGGLNPFNSQIVLRAIGPIFPNMEIDYQYSQEYITGQLDSCCKCGSLACIVNIDLFCYMKHSHFVKYYKCLYETFYKDFEKNVHKHFSEGRRPLKRQERTRQRVQQPEYRKHYIKSMVQAKEQEEQPASTMLRRSAAKK
ncbi:unnamed protein product [Caenorhabditis sp. 36 PRJEB53466]|nr:unnamed protein product [Caenorhabditis sp. 36 PRJEB53466]